MTGSFATSTTLPNLDQVGLIAALNQLSVHNPNPWVLDTSATSHMFCTNDILVTRLSNSHLYYCR
uniref:Uncharacterized protein n=1 Tax=Oryza brachyantha TaxID=4533 RepID=J3MDW4_ORYBR